MEFFTWLEATPLAEWVRTSSFAYPFILTVHALGMGIMTGLAWIISARILGKLRMIPYSSLRPLFITAWFGFIINFISGGALFTSQAASNYVHNIPYLTKMFFVIAGAITIGYLQVKVSRAVEAEQARLRGGAAAGATVDEDETVAEPVVADAAGVSAMSAVAAGGPAGYARGAAGGAGKRGSASQEIIVRDIVMPISVRATAAAAIFIWFAAIVTGRLIAYLT